MSAFQEEVVNGTAEAVSRPLKHIYDLFVSHPKENQMTYREHFCHAMRLSYHMCYGSVCLLIHAFFPFVCKTRGSRVIKKLYFESQKKSSPQDGIKEV